MRFTIDAYSKQFKMSTEMINSKLKAKKLNYIIEDGITYIIVKQSSVITSEEAQPSENPPKSPPPVKQKTTVAMVLSLYQKENQQLKDKIVQLESKIDKLINDKEQMLRDEMSRIEHVYSTKDEQLKNIIELINTKLSSEQTNTVHEVETLTSIEVEKAPVQEKIVELKDYLKTLDLESYQRKVIKKRFLAAYDEDIRVIKQNGKLYLNFSKYDYSDLLEY
ncbi:hypothetical protein GJV85_10325 [Sulfurimonas aquatica]|uniref:DUF3972 domain-containing protein n=1 Tax=Sulfurimonas aquatica TaxID=2672570 RepID=A0A975GDL5_9BACT|nr:hypothetical protein [Sulfurimonas aquatica]QSZ42488.1 hypothetical protein GJV85_10325 [Sulfurimonas aquatica]